jgi:predicted dinucleotide-binding enzyme
MKIGIIGSGNIGATTAHLFAKAGHQVKISNSRGPVSLKVLVKSIGSNNVTAATPERGSQACSSGITCNTLEEKT